MRSTPARRHVLHELLVPEDREPFLERELEPVAAGDAVAGPVVEVLVGHDAHDALEVAVRGGLRVRQHVLGVEDVQPLVLHGAHVEVVGRHDHEEVQVVLPAVDLLVPLHGLLERLHGMAALVLVVVLHIDVERHLPPRHGREPVLDARQVARHEGEEIGRLGERVVPLGEMPAVLQVAAPIRFPFDRSTGYFFLSATMVVMNRASTSGRSG